MIKVGILGAETAAAGELIRILINHPDVSLKTVASESEAGRDVSGLHRGLVGDIDMTVSATLDCAGHEVVFLCGEPWMARNWMQHNDAEARECGLKVIDLTGAFRDGSMDMVYGFPEFNRKALVRGALRASVPSVIASAVEPALFPLAKNNLLSGAGIQVSVTMAGADSGSGMLSEYPVQTSYNVSTRLDPVAPNEHRPDAEAAAAEVSACLRLIQPSFAGPLQITLSRDGVVSRGVTGVVDVPCSISLNEVRRLFEEAYEDHGFTFPVDFTPVVADVANTNKCLVSLEYCDTHLSGVSAGQPVLRITSVTDNLLKGAAGTAVHCMNLLFGLSERTALQLKASAF